MSRKADPLNSTAKSSLRVPVNSIPIALTRSACIKQWLVLHLRITSNTSLNKRRKSIRSVSKRAPLPQRVSPKSSRRLSLSSQCAPIIAGFRLLQPGHLFQAAIRLLFPMVRSSSRLIQPTLATFVLRLHLRMQNLRMPMVWQSWKNSMQPFFLPDLRMMRG